MKALISWAIILLLVLDMPVVLSRTTAHDDRSGPGTDIRHLFGDRFVPNEGQVPDSDVVFQTDNAYFTPTGVIIRVVQQCPRQSSDPGAFPGTGRQTDPGMHIFRIGFLGANHVVPRGIDELPQKSNYFLGNDPGKWSTDVPCYGGIAYANLYDNIDLVYHAVAEGIKYDFMVRPGGDIKDIAMRYDGAGVRTDGRSAFITTSFGTLLDGELVAYQDIGGSRTSVSATMDARDNTVTFAADYDPTKMLVLDPLMHSTFVGGSAYDQVLKIVVNSTSGVFAIGRSTSSDFPTTAGVYNRSYSGNQDIVVFEMDSNLTKLVFSTYIGGTDLDFGYDLKFDSDGNLILAGSTSSSDFPTTANAYDRTYTSEDAVVIKLSSTGNKLLYSTFLGGSKLDFAQGLLLDSFDNIYVIGTTTSNDFPITSGAYSSSLIGGSDIFVSELNSIGDTLVASTYLGGSNDEYINAIENDSIGDLIIVGTTLSNNFPTTTNAYCKYFSGINDGYVTKISKDLDKLIFSTYIGGSNNDVLTDVKLDSKDNVFGLGYTYSNNFPVTDGAYCTTYNSGDCVLFELDSSGANLLFSTFLGGVNSETTGSLALDDKGCIYIAGGTYSLNFPLKGAEFSTKISGNDLTAFCAKMNSNGSALLYSTFLGVVADSWMPMVLDGDIYMSGITIDSQFPTTPDAYDRTLNNCDIFISELKLPTVPDAPGNITAQIGDGTANLSWQQPVFNGYRNVTNFTILRGPDALSLETLKVVSNVTNFIDTGLANGQTYYYSVSASNVMGEGNRSAVINVTPGDVPTAPRMLKARMGDSSVVLNWSPPASIRGYPVTNYTVYRSDSSLPWHLERTVGNVSSYNDSDVINGVYYEYAISAWNAIGEGNRSNIANSTPGRIPSPPVNLTAEAGNSLVNLAWSPPGDNGGYAVRSYKIYFTEDDQERFQAEVTETHYSHIGLENGKSYYYAVSAVNGVGEGGKSDRIEVIPGTMPGVPVVTARGMNGQVHLSWTLDDDGGIPVMYYNVFRRGALDSDASPLCEIPDSEYDDYSVLNGDKYFYSVSAVNAKGEGVRSDETSAIPQGDGRIPGIPGNVTVRAGNAFVNISWNEPSDMGGTEDLDYVVYRGTGDAGLQPLYSVTERWFNDTTVLNGHTYFYAVASRNIKGEGQRSGTVPATPSGPGRLASAPLNLTADRSGPSILLKWDGPSDWGGLQIDGYRIYRKQDGMDFTLLGNSTNAGYFDSMFRFGVLYYYAVSAVNGIGEGPMCIPASLTLYDAPSGVRNLTISAGNKYVLLQWQVPDSDGGSRITAYRIYRGDAPSDTPFYKSSTGPAFNDSGLMNGRTCYYRVSALNDIGEGPLSTAMNATTGTPPGKPLNLTVSVKGSRAALRWQEPANNGGLPVLGYRIYRIEGNGTMQLLASINGLSYSDGSVKEGKHYSYRVTACNQLGEGPASAMASVVTGETGAGNTSRLIQWMAIGLAAILGCGVIAILVWRVRRNRKKG